MTAKIIFGSKNKLGTITTEQLQAMLDKFNLGKLISSSRTNQGAMGQTMFITSTEGDFVLKGNPLYPGQLEEEKFFIDQIDLRTTIPVPTPYIIDDSLEIFDWSYCLMPRLEGSHLDAINLKTKLQSKDKRSIATSIASTLNDFHQWKVETFGELDPNTFEISPFAPTYTDWLFERILFWLEDAKKYSTITSKDFQWVQALLEESQSAFLHCRTPTFVMGDFKPGNFLVQSGENGWQISGVFDFTNSFFADPLSDLIKMLIFYFDHETLEIAQRFVDTYFAETKITKDMKQRIKVHLVHQRVLDWGGAKATNRLTWDDDLSFTDWVETYIERVENLLE